MTPSSFAPCCICRWAACRAVRFGVLILCLLTRKRDWRQTLPNLIDQISNILRIYRVLGASRMILNGDTLYWTDGVLHAGFGVHGNGKRHKNLLSLRNGFLFGISVRVDSKRHGIKILPIREEDGFRCFISLSKTGDHGRKTKEIW